MRSHRNRISPGERFQTKQGCVVEVLGYSENYKYLVEFLDETGYSKLVEKKDLLSGSVKNPFHPEVRGIGFFGVGPYTSKLVGNGKVGTKEYVHWSSMFTRCYSSEYHGRFPTYLGCSVDVQWQNFQEFAEWCQWQTGFKSEGYVLDKDLIIPGNKVYSPETCVFLPTEINNMIVTQTKEGKVTPPGISFQHDYQKYIVSCAINGKNRNLGRYKCPEEAFAVYKKFKENLVREKAEEYKDRIDIRAYAALVNFKVKEGK